MAEHSDEELLAMLQPLAMDFENPLTTKGDTRDEANGERISGPIPPAPVAPLAPMMASAPTAPTDPMDIDGADTFLDTTDSTTNGVDHSKEPGPIDKTKEEEKEDEDQIAYEPIKTPSRTPRSTRARANLSKSKASSRAVGTELPVRQSPVRKSTRKRKPPSKFKSPEPSNVPDAPDATEVEKHDIPAASTARAMSASLALSEPQKIVRTPTPPAPVKEPPKLNFEIVVKPIQPELAQQYTPITPGDEIYRVLERIPTGVPGETWLSVEFEDGRIDQVSRHQF